LVNAPAGCGKTFSIFLGAIISMVSEFLYPFLKTVGYEGTKIYWQNCPMAFGDDKPANWLSTSAEINNPYLGMHHPEFKSAMLHCGETMDSIYAK
jgi:hypothetical protein